MSIFSTRNSDGASGKGESANTISVKDWAAIKHRAQGTPQAGVFTDEAQRFRRAHRPEKAGEN
jgi:hypothetical protein